MNDKLSPLPRLNRAIQDNNPHLSDTDVATMVDGLLREISNHLSAGESVAFVKPKPDGTWGLTVYEIRAKRRRRR